MLLVKLAWKFPDRDWRDYFMPLGATQSKINLRVRHVYLAAALTCLVITMLPLLSITDPVVFLYVSLAALGLAWLCLSPLILMTAYTKEKIFTLL